MKKYSIQATTASSATLFGLLQRQPGPALGCILAGLLFLDSAIGQAPDPIALAPADTVTQYLDAIDRIEGDYGSYASELSDLYLGLGQTLINSGEYEQAKDALHRGVMVLRVNSGPNSPEQTNQLYMLAELEEMLGEPGTADDILHNVYFINSNYYDENSPELLPVLERIYDWYEVRRPLGSQVSRYGDYTRNIDLTKEMLDISEAVYGEKNPEAALAYRRYAEAEFQMVRHLTGLGMAMSREDYVLATSSTLVPIGLGEESVVEHNDKGRRAYKKYLAALQADASTTPLDYAKALADLGDWYMIFDKSRKGRNLYEEAYQLLMQNEGYADLASDFMSRPEPMHFIPTPEPGLLGAVPMELQEMNLEISMTVTSMGQVRSIEFLNPPEDMSEDDLWQIKKQVQETPFRPAIQEGEVETIKDFKWNYTIVKVRGAS